MEVPFYTCSFKPLDSSQQNVQHQFHDYAGDVLHSYGKSNSNVDALIFEDLLLSDFPMGIEQKFCNLVAIQMKNCGIVEITKEHLKPLKMLRNLLLCKNKIMSIPRDLFIYTPSIEVLSFKGNKIIHISLQTLPTLKRLIFADFRDNTNIDLLFKTDAAENEAKVVSMETLMEQIKVLCLPPSETALLTSYVGTLWSTGMFSDFKIRTDVKEFHVHKCILAVNSPVFEAMFKYEMKENLTNEMNLDDVSTDAVHEFLEFLYLRKIPGNSVNAMDLFIISTKYQVNDLRDLSEALIIQAMDVDNAFEILVMACRYCNIRLKTSAFDCISSNILSGWKLPTELMESPDKIKELIDAKKLMEQQLSNAQNEFKKVYEKFCGP